MGYKELADKVNATTAEVKNVTRDIELAIMVVDAMHHDRIRTRSSEDKK